MSISIEALNCYKIAKEGANKTIKEINKKNNLEEVQKLCDDLASFAHTMSRSLKSYLDSIKSAKNEQ